MNDFLDDEHETPARLSKRATGPSRSQRRREALDVLDLAAALMAAPDGVLSKVSMSAELTELVAQSRRVHQLIARKRQTQYLAKHLRREDEESLVALRGALQYDRDRARREGAHLQRLETLRERLIDNPDATLTELLQRHPDLDRTRIRQLARQARQERDRGTPPRAARELFRSLRAGTETNAPSPDDASEAAE